MAEDHEALRLEFDLTRREIDEMAEELSAAEERVAALARQDVQVGDLRDMLAKARLQHGRLQRRERALRAKFQALLGEKPHSTH